MLDNYVTVEDFNPRPREEGDFQTKIASIVTRNFNPRPREEGDTSRNSLRLVAVNFNPRPREEGDATASTLGNCQGISIHALVKRATCAEVYRADDRRDFNPRPREEGDQTST